MVNHLVPVTSLSGHRSRILLGKEKLDDSILFLDFGQKILDVLFQEIEFFTLPGIVTLDADHLFKECATLPIWRHVDRSRSGRRRMLRGSMFLLQFKTSSLDNPNKIKQTVTEFAYDSGGI